MFDGRYLDPVHDAPVSGDEPVARIAEGELTVGDAVVRVLRS